MKKTYIIPQTEVILTEHIMQIAASLPTGETAIDTD